MNIYGSELFNYNSKYVNKLYVAWRKAMRQLFNIDYRTHNYIVFSLSGNIETRLHRNWQDSFLHCLIVKTYMYLML